MSGEPTNPPTVTESPSRAATPGPSRSRGVRWLLATAAAGLGILIAITVVLTFRGEPAARREARVAFQAGRYEEALAATDRWLADQPDAADAWLLKSETLLELDRVPEALQALREARALDTPEAELDRLQGIMLTRAGRFSEAEPLLFRAHQRRSAVDPLLDEALARLFLNRFRLGDAREALKRWAKARPRDPRPYLGMAEVDGRIDGGDEALVNDYRAVLERDPSRDDIRLKLAETLEASGKLEEAAREFDLYLDHHPDDPAALTGAGLIARQRRQTDSAERFFKKALEHDPDHVAALVGLAGIEATRGDFQAALPRLEHAKAVDPENEEARYRLATALDRVGRPEEAAAERKALTELRQSLAEMRAIREALIQTPHDPELQYQAARWLLDHDHPEEALSWARRAAASPGGHSPSARLLADYFTAQGDLGQANYYRLLEDSSPGTAPSKSSQ